MVRHPLDRVISIYELSTVRAARYLLYPNMTSATEAAERQCSERPHAACHRDGRRNQSMMSEEIDPYNIYQIALPLHDFTNDPLVHELVHVTLQVAGLTDNSCLQESHAIRHCIRMHPTRQICSRRCKGIDHI
ncbi:Protein-tyrosine sulfotransferase [Nymphaea thermarum]|nr:Protein-tyrosine sulfotransferase [Nymphaea thermarum]